MCISSNWSNNLRLSKSLNISDLFNCIGESSLLQVTHHLLYDVSQFLIVTGNYLLTFGVKHELAFVWVRHQVVAFFSFIVGENLVEVALEDYTNFLREYLVLSLFLGDVHQRYELWRGILLNLEDKETN